MTKTFCDRCKKETTNDLIIHHFSACEDDDLDGAGFEICDDCYKAFESFMKMEEKKPEQPKNNHGIEIMTFGSR